MKKQRHLLQRMISTVLASLLAVSAMPASALEGTNPGIAIDENNFPDDNFRAYIAENIDGKDNSTKDQFLSNAEIKSVTELNIQNQNISDLTGLSNFTAITTLNCSYNPLGTLDVSELQQLMFLICSNNQLETLDISELSSLMTLMCDDNETLTSLTLPHLSSSMMILSCENCGLTALDVSDQTFLSNLNCSGNQLVSLDVTGLSALKTLTCNDNQRTIVPTSTSSGLFTYDLTQIPELDASRIDQTTLTNGVILNDESDTLYILDAGSPVTYSYQIDTADPLKLAQFTLALDTSKYLEINEANFPDTALRSAVSEYDTDENGYFSLEEIKAITTLSLNNLGIRDMTGIANFTSLETLDCSGNQLSTLDLSDMGYLHTLICDNNSMTSLTLPQVSSLEYLSCQSNLLTSLDLSKQTSLTLLYCGSNQLTCLDTTNTLLSDGSLLAEDNMAEIWVDINGTFELSSLPEEFDVNRIVPGSLQNAVISGTQLIVQNDSNVTYDYYVNEAQTLQVTFCLLPSEQELAINAENFPDDVFRQEVTVYDTDNNGYFSKQELQAVTSLSLSSKSIWDLTGICYFTELTELNCAYNNLTKLDLTGLTKLETLDCSWNALKILTLTDLTTLESLNCNSNNLTELDTPALPALQELQCSQNHLTVLDLTTATELTRLICTMNSLETLKLTRLSSLREVNCSQNKLTALDVTSQPALERLVCASNQLTVLDVSQNPLLEYLQCATNQLTALDLSAQINLTTLYCSNNQLTSLNLDESHAGMMISAKSNKYTFVTDSLNRIRFSDLPGQFDVNRVVEGSWTNAVVDHQSLYAIDPGNVTYSYLTIAGDPESAVTFTLVPQSSSDEVEIPIDEAHFPDAVFRAYVQEKYDIENDWFFSRTELLSVDTIEVAGMGISDLTGIEYFTALEQLDCSSNQLTHLSVINLTNLQEVNCSENTLQQLYLPASNNLQKLFCSYNNLTSLDVSGLPSLTYLSCEANQLEELNVSGLSALQYLYCYDNALSELNLTGLSELQYLECGDNLLTFLELSGLSKLQKLQCQNNQLIALDVTGLTALTTLNADGNCYVIPVKAISKFDLTTLPEYFQPKRVMTDSWSNAICSGDILSIQNISAGVTYQYQIDAEDEDRTVVFTLLPQLVEEDAISIDASTFPDSQFRSYVAAYLDINQDGLLGVSELEAVTSLDVSGLKIADLTGITYFTELTALNCADNQLTSLDGMLSAQLTTLNCSGNQLTSLNVSFLTELTELDCSSNQLTQLDLSNVTALTKLSCQDNVLTRLNVTTLQDLESLNCSNNQLTALQLTNASLTELFCSGNAIVSLDLSSLSKLQQLDCSDNVLESLIIGSEVLTWLHCKNNLLKTLELSNQAALTVLDCSENLLSALELSTQSALTELSAGNNPLLALQLSPYAPITAYDLKNCHALVTPISVKGQALHVDVSAWDGFSPSLASSWKNAQLDGSDLTVIDPLADITYTYNTGNSHVTAMFSVGLETVPMNAASVRVETGNTPLYYTGSPITPNVTVMLGNTTLCPDQDYTVTYHNNINAGTATITITAAGSQLWSGSCETIFQIERTIPKVSVQFDETAVYTEGDPLPELRARDSSTPGTLTWADNSPSSLAAGDNTLTWVFIPDDLTNYQSISSSITFHAAEKIATTTSTTTTTTTT
uniref:leucine-rich repeat domain-containing protein n=1 Tax=Ruminococcus sp. TaxID=41978 RepID=UPI0025FB5683